MYGTALFYFEVTFHKGLTVGWYNAHIVTITVKGPGTKSPYFWFQHRFRSGQVTRSGRDIYSMNANSSNLKDGDRFFKDVEYLE